MLREPSSYLQNNRMRNEGQVVELEVLETDEIILHSSAADPLTFIHLIR